MLGQGCSRFYFLTTFSIRCLKKSCLLSGMPKYLHLGSNLITFSCRNIMNGLWYLPNVNPHINSVLVTFKTSFNLLSCHSIRLKGFCKSSARVEPLTINAVYRSSRILHWGREFTLILNLNSVLECTR